MTADEIKQAIADAEEVVLFAREYAGAAEDESLGEAILRICKQRTEQADRAERAEVALQQQAEAITRLTAERDSLRAFARGVAKKLGYTVIPAAPDRPKESK